MLAFARRHWHLLILIFILLLSFIFRAYLFAEYFNYDHDNDLSSWIVKDIVIDKHFRLIGQLTSAPGIFIGPIFYYLLVPFYMLAQMDPLGGVWLIVILGVLTTLSYYLVFSRIFNRNVGLIGAFLHACSWSLIFFDRRVVPSTPTNLWMVWYFFVIVMLARGKYHVFPLLGVLIGLIWNIHIALLPSLGAVPVALIIARRIPSFRQIFLAVVAFLVISLPLIIFEGRHNFIQTTSLINNFLIPHEGSAGLDKLNLVALMLAKNVLSLVFAPITLPQIDHRIIILSLILIIGVSVGRKLITVRDFLPLLAWILGVVLFFSFSSSLVSEYYFSNLEVIYLAIFSLILVHLFRMSKFGQILIITLLGLFLFKAGYFFATNNIYQKGYIARKAAVEYILTDSRQKQLPCVAVSYITSPGENMGYRYFFWLSKLHLAPISQDSPVYTIVVPDELAAGDIKAKFGHIGVIVPEKIPSREVLAKTCSGENTNLTDSLFGYTE